MEDISMLRILELEISVVFDKPPTHLHWRGQAEG